MKKRPLMYMCLTFLIIRSLILIITGGPASFQPPAESSFQVLIEGQVYKKSNTSKVQILYLKNNSYKSRILIYDDTFQEIAIGKTVKVKGVLTPFEEARNPGNFNQKLYYAKQNIYNSVWSEQILEVSGKEKVFQEKLYQWKIQWKQILYETIGEKNGAVLSAMLLGEKGEMDAEIKELYQKSGIGHLLAISGLHISFVGLGIYKLIRKTGCPYWFSGVVSVLLLSSYVFMIGFSVSVLRAYIMLLLRIGADIAGRVYDMATALAFSATITILYQPLYLFDAGFLMSYGAIIGILLVLPTMEILFPCKNKILQGLYASVAINLMLFPVLLFFYFEFPVYSFLVNMIVIPMMSVVLGLGIFGSGNIFVWKAAGVWMLKGCGLILDFFEVLGKLCSELPGGRVVFGQPRVWQIVIYYIVLGGMLLYVQGFRRKKVGRRMQWCSCVLCVGIVLQFFFGHEKFTGFTGKGNLSVTVIDVGQGDGIFLRGPNGSTYLIDGGSSDVTEVGKYRIEPFLKSQGVGKLDYIFVSHGDLDHINGIEELILRKKVGVRIENLVFPTTYKTDKALQQLAVLAKQSGIQTVVMKSGQMIREEGMTITCVQPCDQDKNLEGNAGSMVLDVSYGAFDMLCTGDVEEKGEEILTENLQGKTYDVLKVAHHGSKNSTSKAFLECVQPKTAVISAGEKNRYGHPHEETIERLKENGCEIYTTIQKGAIIICSDGKTLRVSGFH